MAREIKDTFRLRESWILCFILGIVMLNYPFLHIFNKASTFLGIPILILYFFIGWPISIFIIYLFARVLDASPGSEKNENSEKRDEP
ncbi:MAG: hypothetical protein C0615_08735 [Desulfuromonas sp.]|nr:MAG: hypothetical protein C0615_08735 [Desulfuromonas sp.]